MIIFPTVHSAEVSVIKLVAVLVEFKLLQIHNSCLHLHRISRYHMPEFLNYFL